MQYLKKILLPVLLVATTVFVYGCQSGDKEGPISTDFPAEEGTSEKGLSNPQPVDFHEITHISWQWAELTENDPANQSIVAKPEKYTLTFWDDGTFSMQADCNMGSGSYTVSEDQIEFGAMTSTMAMCEPQSLHDQYLALLDQVETFGMLDNDLVFTLREDAGEMRFNNGGPAEKPEVPTEEPEETETPTPQEKTIFIGPEKVECVGVGPMECYQLKEAIDDEWLLFYHQIEGFEWEAGYTYELRVTVHQVENPPADGSSLRYELIEIVERVETLVELERIEAYIQIDKPVLETSLDTSEPIVITGMGAGLFEGNVVVQILDEEGNELALQPTIIQSPEAGMGGEGPWEIEISLAIATPTDGKILAFSPSPKDGEGWIASDEISVSFTPGMQTDTNADLENTAWILQSFPQQEDINPLLTAYQVTARFNPGEGKFIGVTGCNNYFGDYTLDDDQLVINMPVGVTRMMCTEPQMVLENTYLATLEEIASFEINQNKLVIADNDGNPLLVFQVDAYSKSEFFTRDELANTSYLNEFTKIGIVELVNGIYRIPAAEDSVAELTITLTNYAAFGDIDGDGVEDAVVILVSQPGGSGSFYDLAIVRKQGEALTNMARLELGDRVQIQSVQIENGEIVVEMLTQGTDDPMCCPSQLTREHYVLESGALVLVRSETIE